MPRCTAYVVALLLTWSRLASAQALDSDYVERGPRFLLASTAAPVPVRVDVTRTPVLRQSISLDLNGVALGDALREISAKAGMQLAFSNTMLPPERTVTFRADHITVAAALTELLIDAQVDVLFSRDGRAVLVRRAEEFQGGTVSGKVTDAKTGKAIASVSVYLEGTRWRTNTGEDGAYRLLEVTAGTYTVTASRIGYAKQSQSVTVAARQEVTVDVALPAAATELEQVVVTGTVVPTERKAIPTPISVVTADEIEQKGYQRVDQIFRGDVPGAIAWDRGALNYTSDINIRGTSNLSGAQNQVKTYIDGVEVADPILLTTIDPGSIDRIEVLRGPQGSTIYGSDANGGVMQIFTKKGAFNTPHPEVEAKISAGLVQSRWDNAAQQDYSLGVSGGGQNLSYRVGGGYLHNANWLDPFDDAHSTNASLYGGLRGTQGPLTVELSARYYDKSFGYPNNPDFRQYTQFSKPSDEIYVLRQQTDGLTLKYAATPRWQHSVTLGFDRSAYDYYLTQPRFTTPADSFVYAFSAEETKTSVAYNTAVEVSLGPSIQSSLVAGVDHWNYHQGGFYSGNTSSTSGTFTAPTFGYRNEYTNTGYFVQEQVGFRNALFVTAGVRAEDNQNFGKDFGLAWAPRVGASYVRALGDVVVKARLSYGKAIRPPAPGYARTIITSSYEQLGNINLGPEEQFGSDGGLEFYFGRRGSLEATYYHQTAVDLIDQVFLGNSPVYTFQYQNVGKIKNTGWEFQGHLNAGRFSLNATYSYTNSVVQTLSPTYGGDLLPGDHLRHIPKHTGGVTLGYRLGRTALDLGMTYVGPWTEYDYGALFGYFYGGQPFRGSLRDYWITYPSFAKFNFAVSQTVTDRFSVFLRSDNLFNNDVSEPVNLYPNLGRVTMIGLQMR